MAMDPSFPSMGATLFFGLTFAALVTQGAPEPESNPVINMGLPVFEVAPVDVFRTAQMSWRTLLLNDDPRLAVVRSALTEVPDTAPSPPAGIQSESLPRTVLQARINPPDWPSPSVDVTAPGSLEQGPQPSVLALSALGPGVKSGTRPEPDAAPEKPDVMPRERTFGAPAGGAEGLLSRTVQRPPNTAAKPAAPRADATQPTGVVLESATAPKPDSPGASVIFQAPVQMTPVSMPLLPRQVAALVPEQRLHGLSPFDQPYTSPKPRAARVNGDRVFLRRGPSLRARPITQFDTGTPALIWEARGDWRRVKIEGIYGWMFESFLTPRDR